MNLRLKLVQDWLKSESLDALIISNYYNIYYLIGFKGLSPTEREAWVLITKKRSYFFTDARYAVRIKNFETKFVTHEKNIVAHLKEIVETEKLHRVGFEADDLKYREFQSFSKHFDLVPTNSLLIKIRAVKYDDEVNNIKKACQIADQCLKDIIPHIKPGKTEREIALKIEWWLKEKNSDVAFYPIVAVDANAAIPHYDTKADATATIKKGSVVLIDFGAVYKNYLSDMTRMVFLGKPNEKIAKAYNTLLFAQQKAVAELKKIKDPAKIDSVCRELITNNQFPNYSHSTGHGVGLEIHESPKISHKSEDVIAKNQIFTIEPGIYIEGKFGMRIEDTVWMRDDLTPEILTRFPKKLLII